ncbi:MAG: ribosomal RNA small subunit methyltransferase A [Patescibacteria group bacterium]|nr:ribosomal RNA small subunit methyltransferase A [Patescibacteria group bacterium]
MRPKKRLGQHFLAPAWARTVAESAQLEEDNYVFEIGPGRGVLTKELLLRGARTIAIEKDRALVATLKTSFEKEIKDGRLTLIEGDALEIDVEKLGLKNGKYTIVANIPYYITGALLEKFLSQPPRPKTLVFLMQKEVAERIAKAKKESLLSLSVKAYGTPHYLNTVPRGAFNPAPEVDSAILRIEGISDKKFDTREHEKRFFELIRAGFAHKRKLLSGNLKNLLGRGGEEALAGVGLPKKVRAEDVPLEQWLLLARQDP